MKGPIPSWDVRAFEAQVEDQMVDGHVTCVSISPPGSSECQYVVEVSIRDRFFKFTILNEGRAWVTYLVSVFEPGSKTKIGSIDTFRHWSTKIENLFTDALLQLNHYPDDEND